MREITLHPQVVIISLTLYVYSLLSSLLSPILSDNFSNINLSIPLALSNFFKQSEAPTDLYHIIIHLLTSFEILSYLYDDDKNVPRQKDD